MLKRREKFLESDKIKVRFKKKRKVEFFEGLKKMILIIIIIVRFNRFIK